MGWNKKKFYVIKGQFEKKKNVKLKKKYIISRKWRMGDKIKKKYFKKNYKNFYNKNTNKWRMSI